VNSKVTGSLLIVGPILAMAMWIALLPDTSGQSISEGLDALVARETGTRIGAFGGMIGMACMLFGFFFVSRSMKDGNSSGAACAEIGGLLLLLSIPMMYGSEGFYVAAVEHAHTDRSLAEGILTAKLGIEGFGAFSVTTGIFILGLAITLQRKFHVVVGYLLMIVAACATIDEVMWDAHEIIPTVGWLGMMLMSVVTGILTLRQKGS